MTKSDLATYLDTLDYKQLQDECKKRGLSAGAKTSSLKRRIIGHHNASLRKKERIADAHKTLAKSPTKKRREESYDDEEEETVIKENGEDLKNEREGEDLKNEREGENQDSSKRETTNDDDASEKKNHDDGIRPDSNHKEEETKSGKNDKGENQDSSKRETMNDDDASEKKNHDDGIRPDSNHKEEETDITGIVHAPAHSCWLLWRIR